MNIRLIDSRDNAAIEAVIRDCLIEFGANRAGLAWEDESLKELSQFYQNPRRAYWVIEEEGNVLGGCGIAPFAESDDICELQKMYLSKEIRGTGVATQLLNTALDFAKQHYHKCYLETLSNMHAAHRFYQKNRFKSLCEPLSGSEHFACDSWYIKDLS